MIREGNEWMGTLISLPCTLRTNFPPLCSLYRLEKERRIKSDRVWWQVILGENKLLTQALLLIHVPSPILETLLRLNFKRGHWQVEYSAAILSIYQTGVDWQVLIANKHMLKFPPTNKCCCRTICAFCKVKNLLKKKATNKQKKEAKQLTWTFFLHLRQWLSQTLKLADADIPVGKGWDTKVGPQDTLGGVSCAVRCDFNLGK